MTERQALPAPYFTHPFGRELYTDEQMWAYGDACRIAGVHSVHQQTAVIVRAALELLEAVEGCEGFPPEKMAAFRRVFGA